MLTKFRSISKEDIDQFFFFFFNFKKISDLYLKKIQISFLIEKNSDLHLMKMQISILIEKI